MAHSIVNHITFYKTNQDLNFVYDHLKEKNNIFITFHKNVKNKDKNHIHVVLFSRFKNKKKQDFKQTFHNIFTDAQTETNYKKSTEITLENVKTIMNQLLLPSDNTVCKKHSTLPQISDSTIINKLKCYIADTSVFLTAINCERASSLNLETFSSCPAEQVKNKLSESW